MDIEAIEYLACWVALKYKSTIPEIGYKSKKLKSQKYYIYIYVPIIS